MSKNWNQKRCRMVSETDPEEDTKAEGESEAEEETMEESEVSEISEEPKEVA